jgi:hypothetical protein
VLGKRSNSIKAMAAAAAGPAAPNNCVLCVLEPTTPNAMLLTGSGGIDVTGGGIVVNSRSDSALHLLPGAGDVTALQIRVIGRALVESGGGQLLPPAEEGGPPAVDPLADLPSPDQLVQPPPAAVGDDTPVITADTTLEPGVYRSIDVRSGGILTLQEGVYVITDFLPGVPEFPGFVVRDGGRVEGDGATIYLACPGYPTPCAGPGARFRLENGAEFDVSRPTRKEYAGLSIFADKGNTGSIELLGGVTLEGAVYAASAPLVVNSSAPVEIDALVAVDSLLKANTGQLVVDYDPSSPLIGIGRPVLIR